MTIRSIDATLSTITRTTTTNTAARDDGQHKQRKHTTSIITIIQVHSSFEADRTKYNARRTFVCRSTRNNKADERYFSNGSSSSLSSSRGTTMKGARRRTKLSRALGCPNKKPRRGDACGAPLDIHTYYTRYCNSRGNIFTYTHTRAHTYVHT